MLKKDIYHMVLDLESMVWNCLWLHLRGIFSNCFAIYTCSRSLVICQYLRFPSGKNLSYFQSTLFNKIHRDSDTKIWRYLAISFYDIPDFWNICLVCCSYGLAIFAASIAKTDSLQFRNVFLYLWTVSNMCTCTLSDAKTQTPN